METTQESHARVSVHVENVGGIVETDVELRPGVNVLTGRNATNRTSFLRSVMAAMGSDDVSLRGDADEGVVELTIGEETYVRRLRRDERVDAGGGNDGRDSVVTSGDPYLEDPTVVDVFAFLLESNAARRAVAGGGDLREVVMRPVDTEEIESEIDRLETEKREIDAAIGERNDLVDRLDELRDERSTLEDRIESAREEHAEANEEIEAADADLEETREGKAALDEKLGVLQDRRSNREEIRYRLQTERESLERLRDERSAVKDRLDRTVDASVDELGKITGRIADLRERKRDLEAAVNQLQGIIQFNQGMLAGDGEEGVNALPAVGDSSAESVTAGLLPDAEELVCWTCGTETEREQVEETLEGLRDRHRELVARRRSVADELGEAIERKESFQEARAEREAREAEYRRLGEEIEETESAVERLDARREELGDEIDRLEEEVEALREEDLAAVVDLHARANELEFEVDRLENRRDRLREQMEEVRGQIDDLDALAERRERVNAELEEARTRIERLEEEVVESFNDHMKEVLAVLEYDNVDRIWLERTGGSGQGSRGTRGGTFDLHVVRTTGSGTAYEDVVDHLSESEREVTGLVFALAGYLVHEVYEAVPFMLLDSLEAIDAERIGTLVEYFGEYAPYLVVALLPEDAAAVDGRHRRVESI